MQRAKCKNPEELNDFLNLDKESIVPLRVPEIYSSKSARKFYKGEHWHFMLFKKSLPIFIFFSLNNLNPILALAKPT